MRNIGLIALMAVSAGLGACIPRSSEGTAMEKPVAKEMLTVTGSATYRERMALPADAVVIVRIEDISLADAPSITLSEQRITPAGRQVPIPFSLKVQRDKLPEAIRNTLSIRIEDGQGKLLWITDTSTPVEPDDKSATIDMGMVTLIKV